MDKLPVTDVFKNSLVLGFASLPPRFDADQPLDIINLVCCSLLLCTDELQLPVNHLMLALPHSLIGDSDRKVLLSEVQERANFVNLLPHAVVLLPEQS